MDEPNLEYLDERASRRTPEDTEGLQGQFHPRNALETIEVLEQLGREYVSTSNLLQVRSVAYAVQEEEDRQINKAEEEPPKNVNEKLYAQSLAGKDASERMKEDAKLDRKC